MILNSNEEKVLSILRKDPYSSQQTMASQLGLSRPAVANLISSLQEKGYILGKPYVLKETDYVTCIGGANLDYTLRLDKAIIVGTSNPVSSNTSLGGVIRNVAENLARLNHPVSLMTCVGDDSAGDTVLKESKKLMDVFASDVITGATTGSYYSVIEPNGNMHVGFANMAINDHMTRSWIIEHKRHLRLSTWILADTNIQKDALEALIEFTNNEGKNLVIIGVSGPKMARVPDDLTGVHTIICNVDETQAYFNTNETNIETLVQLWKNKAIRHVVITNGKAGSAYADKDTVSIQSANRIDEADIVDVTGAGDAFSSAVIHGLMNNQSLKDSVKLGTINARLTIESPHAVNKNLSINLLKKEL
jgi:sugar/nucleoside kinase (ribokinase family)/DNA-binding CsgD family transcriptional regulator